MQTFKRVNWLLLVHDPEVKSVLIRSSHKILSVDYIQSVHGMQPARIKQLRVLINLPEDDLAVHGAGNDAIATETINGQDVAMVTVVGVQVGHLSEVPHFQCSILRNSVKLIVLCVEGHACDAVAMA